jgi:plastocyanin
MQNRWLLLGAGTAALLAVLLFFGTTCGGCSQDSGPPKRTPTPIDPATVGTIRSIALFKGTPPPRKQLVTGGDPACSQEPPPFSEQVIVSERSGRQVLQNAFVWIKGGLGSFVPAVPESPVVVDQRLCIFRPHVVGVQRYQTLRFTNSDQTEHNVKFADAGRNPAHDQSMTGAGQKLDFWFPEEAVMMKVICNKHSWMTCWIGVVDHPWFAVTGAEGTVELKGIPPGTYTVGCWTEIYGVKEQPAKLDPKGAVDLEFSFSPKE